MQNIKSLIKSTLPENVFLFLKRTKENFTSVKIGPPVIQIYLATEEIDSNICVNNFYSCFFPELDTTSHLSVCFYNSSGKKILKIFDVLPKFGSKVIKVSQVFKAHNISSQHGLVTVQLIPKNKRIPDFKKLGSAYSHFFVYYESKNGSVAQTHPSSVMSKDNKPSGRFISNQIIYTKDLKSVSLIQANPCFESFQIEHYLCDLVTQKRIMGKSSHLDPMGTNIIHFDISDQKDLPSELLLEIAQLPSANSKPLLRRNYSNAFFSMSHS